MFPWKKTVGTDGKHPNYWGKVSWISGEGFFRDKLLDAPPPLDRNMGMNFQHDRSFFTQKIISGWHDCPLLKALSSVSDFSEGFRLLFLNNLINCIWRVVEWRMVFCSGNVATAPDKPGSLPLAPKIPVQGRLPKHGHLHWRHFSKHGERQHCEEFKEHLNFTVEFFSAVSVVEKCVFFPSEAAVVKLFARRVLE